MQPPAVGLSPNKPSKGRGRVSREGAGGQQPRSHLPSTHAHPAQPTLDTEQRETPCLQRGPLPGALLPRQDQQDSTETTVLWRISGSTLTWSIPGPSPRTKSFAISFTSAGAPTPPLPLALMLINNCLPGSGAWLLQSAGDSGAPAPQRCWPSWL